MLRYLNIIIPSIISGLLMGMIGIGGATILTPLLMISGLTLEQSVAIVLFVQVIPETLPALYMYYKNKHFLWKEALIILAGSISGISIGAYISSNKIIPKIYLYRLMAISLFLLSILIWYFYC